ncbi:MAG: hypothetical protein IPJ19_00480 [Planctomycetes bacterium]|nr:hypothetical protein [Planctomycetota bacterium]
MTTRRLLAPLAALFVLAPLLCAHEGPPFPVLVNEKVGPYTTTLYADPDIGVGTFFVNFDPPAWKSDSDPRVWIEAWPTSGRLPPARFDAPRQRDESYIARVDFDRGEMWQVKLHVDGSLGNAERQIEVEATPPGYGSWDLLIYAGPFLVLGGLWAFVALRRRRIEEDEEPSEAPKPAR